MCPDNLVFIIGSGSSEFEKDINVIRDVLKKFGYDGYFALLSEKEKGLDSFCDKICSKILGSQFCVVMLNDPIIQPEQYPDSAKKGVVLRGPRPNVYYEYGIAVAANKNIIPVMRRDMKLPFDVQHLDAILYTPLDELRTKLMVAIQEIINKPNRRRFVKEPDIELFLVDGDENPVKSLHVKPLFEKVIKKKISTLSPTEALAARLSRTTTNVLPLLRTSALLYGGSQEAPEDLVPIGICITNNGEAPANDIRIFLSFPSECELTPERLFSVGSLAHLALASHNPTKGGLYIDKEDETAAWAWTDKLSNDLAQRKFQKVYVKFPQKKCEYVVTAQVTQDYYPPKEFEFSVLVEPEIKEKIEYVYEEESPEDTDPEVLEKRIKGSGEKEKQEK